MGRAKVRRENNSKKSWEELYIISPTIYEANFACKWVSLPACLFITQYGTAVRAPKVT